MKKRTKLIIGFSVLIALCFFIVIKFFIKDVIVGVSGVGFITEKRFVNPFAGEDPRPKLQTRLTYETASYSHNVKTTVYVETPDGIKTGAAVRNISSSKTNQKSYGLSGSSPDIYGEAIPIDLGEYGVLIALIDDNSTGEFTGAFPIDGPETYEGIKYYSTLKIGAKGNVPKIYWPKFITFTDPKNPRSIKDAYQTVQCIGMFRKKPGCDGPIGIHEHINNLTELFGTEIKIFKIESLVTDEDVTKGQIINFIPGNEPIDRFERFVLKETK